MTDQKVKNNDKSKQNSKRISEYQDNMDKIPGAAKNPSNAERKTEEKNTNQGDNKSTMIKKLPKDAKD